jgi:hypothetical protein
MVTTFSTVPHALGGGRRSRCVRYSGRSIATTSRPRGPSSLPPPRRPAVDALLRELRLLTAVDQKRPDGPSDPPPLVEEWG